jgi:hypothetical protein
MQRKREIERTSMPIGASQSVVEFHWVKNPFVIALEISNLKTVNLISWEISLINVTDNQTAAQFSSIITQKIHAYEKLQEGLL